MTQVIAKTVQGVHLSEDDRQRIVGRNALNCTRMNTPALCEGARKEMEVLSVPCRYHSQKNTQHSLCLGKTIERESSDSKRGDRSENAWDVSNETRRANGQISCLRLKKTAADTL